MRGLRVNTAAGGFTILLHEKRAPVTSRYFRHIARRGDLDGGAVFRITSDRCDALSSGSPTVPPIHVIQLGTAKGLDEPHQSIPHESTDQTGLTHKRWTVSASRYGPGEVYASFFVCMRDEPCLDVGGPRNPDGQGYAVFGKVIHGHDTLTAIYASAQDQEMLDPPVMIETVTLVHAEQTPG